MKDRSWEYRFFVEFIGNFKEPATLNALKGIKEEAVSMRIFGNY
jgi:chorismate mutase/prephenate dehydratase